MIRAVTLLFLLLASQAAAFTEGFPALFDVTGVEPDDVLNIRREPEVGSDVVAALSPDAKNIEVIRQNKERTWGLINAGEGSGWVSLTFMERSPVKSAGRFPAIRQCFGTEPFWSLAIDRQKIQLEMPDKQSRSGLISSHYASKSRRDRFAFRGSFFPAKSGVRDILLSVRLGTCFDGMSDREYGIAVDMLFTAPDPGSDQSATGLYSGCCSIQPPSR